MTPLVVYFFIAISLLVYVYPYLIRQDPMRSKYDLATNENTLKYHDYARLFTSQFTHWDVFHLGVNMFSLFSVGTTAYVILSLSLFELGRYAVLAFSALYLFCGVMAALFSINFGRRVSAGASGAIFGIIGFITVFAFLTGQTALLSSLVLTIMINVAIGFMPGLNIDNWGHLGGFVGGVAFGLLFILGVPRLL